MEKDKPKVEETINYDKIFVKNINTSYLNHKKYEDVLKSLDIVLNSTKINGFILEGLQGLGKSTIVTAHLKKINKEFVYLNNHSTKLSMYKTLYNNRDKIIIIDDIGFNWKELKGLLNAILNNGDNRILKYESTSSKLDVPSSFIFKGKIIILDNDIKTRLDDSTLSRVILRDLSFSLDEFKDLTKDIIKHNYDKLKDKEVNDIYKFIEDNLKTYTKNFSFRTILKTSEIYFNCEDWEIEALKEFEIDEELKFIGNNLNLSVKERNSNWKSVTGKTIRTLQRKVKEYNKITGGL